MHGIRLPLVLSFITAIATSAAAQTPQCEPEKVSQKYPTYAGKVVKIAVAPSNPPYTFVDPSSPERMTGFEVDLIEAAMACAGLKYEYWKGNWSGLLPTISSGASDVMIGAVNYRPDRAEKVDFILYFRTAQGVIVPKGNPKKIGEPSSLCGTTGTATIAGSSALMIERQSGACVQQGKAAIKFMPAADSDASYRQLPLGRFDFVMDDAVTANVHVAKDPEIEIAHTIVTDTYSGMVVRKGNDELSAIIANGLKVQESNSAITTAAKKYGFPAPLLVPVEIRK